MQKKIIALAIAGLASTAAFAQSNVTIYGVADATFDYVGAKNAVVTNGSSEFQNYQNRTRVTSNSSYIGFKGVEDLGNGLKAVFQFENGLNTDGTAGVWNNRDSYVGLAGGFGTVVAGNVTGPTRALGAKFDVNSGATGIGANSALLGKLGGAIGGAGAGAFDQRINNAVAYITPTFGGFNAVVGYSSGFYGPAGVSLVGQENALKGNSNHGNTAWTFGANFATGPIYVGYAYTAVNASSAADTTAVAGLDGLTGGISRLSNNRLGVQANIGTVATVGVLWDQTRADAYALGGARLQDVYYVSGKVNLGKSAILAQYGLANDVRGPQQGAVVAGNNTLVGSGAQHFVLGYEYNLSKRTVLKAVYSEIMNKERGTYDYLYGVSNANTTATGGALAGGADPRGLSVGVRHSF